MKNIRVQEAADYVGLSKSSMDKLRCFGGGPRFFKLGRAVIYDVADLDAWVSERSRANTWQPANENVRAVKAA